MLATAKSEEIGRDFGKNAGEWTGRVEKNKQTNKEQIPGKKRSMNGYVLTYSRL